MNFLRTALLLAALTAIFMGVGFLIGGSGGMVIAFLVAAGMNFFTYWNADKLVLAMNHAREVDARTAPEFYGIVRELAARAGLPMPRVYVDRQSAAQRLCHRAQSRERRGRRHHRPALDRCRARRSPASWPTSSAM